ncbi:Sbal_3080 family lipoprotein [Amphritea sp. 2_MG-2023]|uniref:Sbal_3080 family lipoprotein n=1 Tax=Amphritea TaxID=515417 RepID=UPI001C06D684|nr:MULTISPECIES: Sbal_3080 family lipoprotein [Amphritea]MBU2967470.1 hypothetical protein [Amphritea atlantica]MDO6418275.1 Sbal_3080 family lipoprotein [Amphritea sp. 2_MG-2023]
MFKELTTALLALTVAGCSITQSVEPAELTNGSELCIIENTDVRAGFLHEFESVLTSKDIPYRIINQRAVPESCEWTSTYVAYWKWDLALYMSYAEIKVFHRGSLDGVAEYDSSRGGVNLSKFIDSEPKIRELIDKLMQIKSASIFFSRFG